MNTANPTIGAIIREARLAAGLTQAQLGARMGHGDHTTVYQAEKGRAGVSLEAVPQWATALRETPREQAAWAGAALWSLSPALAELLLWHLEPGDVRGPPFVLLPLESDP